MSFNNNFHDNKIRNFKQNAKMKRARSESDEEREKDKKRSKSSKLNEESIGIKPELDVPTTSLQSKSHNAIPEYSVEKPGLIVLYNQENFPDKDDKRDGTNKDVDDLKQRFSDKSYFHVISKKDKDEKQVKEHLACIAKDDEYEEYCYIIIFFLSHGDVEGKIQLSCGNYVTNEEIWQPFCSEKSIWKDKPKIFIFQACKGGDFTYTDNSNRPNEEICTDIGKNHKIVPKEADILVAYSTVEGNVSLRGSNGSWYIQELCRTIDKYGKCEDIIDILTRVNYELANNHEVHGTEVQKIPPHLRNKTIKQMPMFLSTLTKKFYFYSPAIRQK